MALVKDYARLLSLSGNDNLGPNGIPPTQQEVLQLVFDPNNSTMVSTGLYTTTEVNAIRNAAFQYFLTQFGIDFINGVPAPGFPPGSGALFDTTFTWLLIPYASGVKPGTEIRVDFDSTHLRRGIHGKWRGYQFGQVAAAVASGTFGGLSTGLDYVAGDVITDFQYNLLNTNGNPPGPQYKREVIRMRTPWVSKTIQNNQGYSDTLSKLEAIDECGNIGFVLESIMFQRDLLTTIVTSKTRVIATWDNQPCCCDH
jgi:hypothetical protein